VLCLLEYENTKNAFNACCTSSRSTTSFTPLTVRRPPWRPASTAILPSCLSIGWTHLSTQLSTHSCCSGLQDFCFVLSNIEELDRDRDK
jgi:hypothetical protein